MSIKNPFVISGYVSPYYFCDREDETKLLLRHLLNNRNTALISTRRMGKTGLIRHCFQMPEVKDNFHCFFVDIYATSNLNEFAFLLGKEVFESLQPKGSRFIDQFLNIITSLRAAFKIDAVSGEPTFEIGLGEITEPEKTIEEIFQYLEQANKPCIVAIDEFQQIAHYAQGNTEAILRTIIQSCKNTYFVFAGSQQHIMSNIFQSAARPFYQSVTIMQLIEIPFEKYREFVIFHFEQNNRAISTDVIQKVYSDFDGHTWYMQILFNEMFSLTNIGESVTMELYVAALNNIISSQIFTFQEIFARLPQKQKEVFIAIAKEGKAKAINSTHFVRKYQLRSASSVQSAVKYLIDKDLVTQYADAHIVYDRFFGIWINKSY